MSRRDIIIVSVFFNLMVLGLLFFTALPAEKNREDRFKNAISLNDLPQVEQFATPQPRQEVKQPLQEIPKDIVDSMLCSYLEHEEIPKLDEPIAEVLEMETAAAPPTDRQYVEVIVKRGDALEKIARANGSSVREIRSLNGLTNDRLDIGQVLLIPVPAEKLSCGKEILSERDEASFYVMKAGDNPWRVARQHHVAFNELLRLNNLDEEKARHLRVGDKIRVK